MIRAVVYAFAVEDGLTAPAGAAPLEVLSRQLPRLIVNLLNGPHDRGLRFFPLMGHDGRRGRRFFTIGEQLAAERLAAMHGQDPAPQRIVDGRIERDGLRLRVLDAAGGREQPRQVFADVLPFAADEPLPAVSRAMFELAGVFGWSGAPPDVPELPPPALREYLIARDDLLALEADFLHPERGVLDASVAALELAPESEDVRSTFAQISARLIRNGTAAAQLRDILRRAFAIASPERIGTGAAGRFGGVVAGLLESAGDDDGAIELYTLIAERDTGDANAVSRAAVACFAQGRTEDARRLLRRAFAEGSRAPAVLAQLAAIELQCGDRAAHAALIDELDRLESLPPAVARLVSAHLVDRGRHEDALARVARALAEDDGEVALWLEKARVLLCAQREADALSAIDAARARDPSDGQRREAERLARLAARPGAMAAMRQIDATYAADADRGPRLAVRRAVELTREYPDLPEAWLLLGVARQRLGQVRRAERALRRALGLQPDLGEAHNRLGILLVGRARYRDGHRHLTAAARRCPGDASVQIHLAQACHYLGRRVEGLAALEAATRMGGDAAMVDSVRRAFFSSGDER